MFLIPFAALLLGGCYRYVPAGAGSVPAGSAVRVELSGDAARRMEEVMGRELRYLSGELEGWADEVVLSVPLPSLAGSPGGALRQRVVLTPQEILDVDVRELHRGRTAALSGVIAVGVTAAIFAVFRGLSSSEDFDPTDPPDESSRVPVPLGRFR